MTNSSNPHQNSAQSDSRPAFRGGALALLAAALFGLSTPLVQRFRRGLGAFSTAALLYAGAAFVALWMRHPVEFKAKLQRSAFHSRPNIAFVG